MKNNIVTLERVFELSIQRQNSFIQQTYERLFNTKEHFVKESHLNLKVFRSIWKVFARWTEGQLELNRTVILGSIATVTYKYQNPDRVIQLQFLESYLVFNGLNIRTSGHLDYTNPTVKINFTWIAKSLLMDKLEIQTIVNTIFLEISEMITSKQQIEILLDILGAIKIDSSGILDVIPSTPRINPNQNYFYAKVPPSLKSKIIGELSYSIPTSNLLPKIVQQTVSQPNSPKPIKSAIDIDTSLFIQHQRNKPFSIRGSILDQLTDRQMMPPKQSPTSSMRFRSNSPSRNKVLADANTNVKIPIELLGAGYDALSRDHHFSKQAYTGKKLFESVFTSQFDTQRLPPVCDPFSRTLAAPFGGIFKSLTGKIGSNYSLDVKRLQLDPVLKQLIFVGDEVVNDDPKNRLRKQKQKLKRLGEQWLKPIASEKEELLYILYGINAKELQQKVEEKRNQIERYMQYIELGIQDEHIAPIDPLWIKNILLKVKFTMEEKSQVDLMLQEAVKLYYSYMKSSILDYILIDPQEQLRLGLWRLNYNQVWGQPKDNILANFSHTMLVANKHELQGNLMSYQQSVVQIMMLWEQMKQKVRLLDLNKENERIVAMNINEFFKLQVDQIAYGGRVLQNQFIAIVQQIYKHFLSRIGSNEEFAQRFHRNHGVLLSLLMRDWVTSYAKQYTQYMRKWSRPYYQKLLTVQLVENGKSIELKESPTFMRDHLLKIFESLIELSRNIIKPEEMNSSESQARYLQEVSIRESSFQLLQSQLNDAIEWNLSKATATIDVYEKYSYLNSEIDQCLVKITGKTQGQLSNSETVKPVSQLLGLKCVIFTSESLMTREMMAREIEKYNRLWQQILKEVPFEVETNLMIIEGGEMKKKYLRIVEQCIDLIIIGVFEYIMKRNQQIYFDSNRLLEYVSVSVEEVEKLVELEATIERILRYEYYQLSKEYKELVQWLLFIMNYQVKVTVEDLKLFYLTSQVLNGMMSRVGEENERMKRERSKFENLIQLKSTSLRKDIINFALQLDQLRNFTSLYMVKEANEFIDQQLATKNILKQNYKALNQLEHVLGQDETVFIELDKAINYLQGYETMWRLIKRYQQSMTTWQKEIVVFKLNPQEIGHECKDMHILAIELLQLFKIEEQGSNSESRKRLSVLGGPLRILTEMQQGLEDFVRQIPLIDCLCTVGLKDRHWDLITALFRFPISIDKDITLKRLIELEVVNHVVELQGIVDKARLEFDLECQMQRIIDEWREQKIELYQFEVVRDGWEFVFNGDQINELLEKVMDDIMRMEELRKSEFSVHQVQSFEYWQNWLHFTKQLLPGLVECQGSYLDICPRVQGESLRQISGGMLKWREIQQKWNHVIRVAQMYPKIVDFTKQRDLLGFMEDNIKLLQFLGKALSFSAPKRHEPQSDSDKMDTLEQQF